VAREGNEPYDFVVEVGVTGLAPRKADPLGAKAAAKLTYTLREGDAKDGFFGGVDMAAAGPAFHAVARECGLREAELATFSATSTTPMNPEFDMMGLASDAVDSTLGCVQIARFFRDVHTRFARAAPPAP
jgi:hypothetical protein